MDVDGAGGLEKACRRWQHRAREFWLSVQRRRDGNDMGNLYEGAWAYMVAMDWPMASTLGFGLRACSGLRARRVMRRCHVINGRTTNRYVHLHVKGPIVVLATWS